MNQEHIATACTWRDFYSQTFGKNLTQPPSGSSTNDKLDIKVGYERIFQALGNVVETKRNGWEFE